MKGLTAVKNGGYGERMERRRQKRVRVVQKAQISLQTVQILREKS